MVSVVSNKQTTPQHQDGTMGETTRRPWASCRLIHYTAHTHLARIMWLQSWNEGDSLIPTYQIKWYAYAIFDTDVYCAVSVIHTHTVYCMSTAMLQCGCTIHSTLTQPNLLFEFAGKVPLDHYNVVISIPDYIMVLQSKLFPLHCRRMDEEGVGWWMDKWMENRRMDEWMDDGWKVDGWMDDWQMDGWMIDRWMDGWLTDGWIDDGWIDGKMVTE